MALGLCIIFMIFFILITKFTWCKLLYRQILNYIFMLKTLIFIVLYKYKYRFLIIILLI